MLQSKFWQGFFAIAPIAMLFFGLIAYFIFLFYVISNSGDMGHFDENYSDSMILGNIGLFFLFILIAVFVSLGSLVFYIVHAANNPNLRQNNMLLIWILLFVFANGIGQLIYWIVEIINKRDQQTQAA